jgi:hypothetical protein
MIIKKAEYVSENKIKLLFSDGITKIVDFTPFLASTRKIIAPLLDTAYFKKFYVDEITICWPNGLDFAPELLYKVGEDLTKEKKGHKLTARRKRVSVPAKAMTKKRPKKSVG